MAVLIPAGAPLPVKERSAATLGNSFRECNCTIVYMQTRVQFSSAHHSLPAYNPSRAGLQNPERLLTHHPLLPCRVRRHFALFVAMPERMISEVLSKPDVALELTLRPSLFSEFTGQPKVKERLEITVAAARQRGEAIDHILLSGPPGLGETTLANIIAKAMGANVKCTSGPTIEKAGDLAGLLTNLEEGDVLFIDEIHRLQKTIEEYLYPAMEDFKLDI